MPTVLILFLFQLVGLRFTTGPHHSLHYACVKTRPLLRLAAVVLENSFASFELIHASFTRWQHDSLNFTRTKVNIFLNPYDLFETLDFYNNNKV